LHVVDFDIEVESGRDRIAVITSLTHALVDPDHGTAGRLFDRLLALAADWDAQGSTIDEGTLRGALAPDFDLTRSPRHSYAWNALLRWTEDTKEAIGHDLTSSYHLDRLPSLDQLVSRLQGEPPVIVTGEPGVGKSALVTEAISKMQGEGLVLNLRQLSPTVPELENQLRAGFTEVLSQAATKARGILVIDASEAVLERHEAVLHYLLRATASRSDLWQICLVSRTEGLRKIQTAITTAYPNVRLSIFEVPGLSHEELQRVGNRFPDLARLLSVPRAQHLMQCLLYVDMVLRRQITLDLPLEKLCEADLLESFWEETVELGGRSDHPNGSPSGRTQAMVALAKAQLHDKTEDDISFSEPAALSGLKRDGLLRQFGDGGTLGFVHDVIRDFAVARTLLRASNPTSLLLDSAPRWSLRAARLACQAKLCKAEAALRPVVFSQIERDFSKLSERQGERWGEVPWEGLITSRDPEAVLEALREELFAPDSLRAALLLDVLKRRFVNPGGLAELPAWEGPIVFLLRNVEALPPAMLTNFDEAVQALLFSNTVAGLLQDRGISARGQLPLQSSTIDTACAYFLERLPKAREKKPILQGLALCVTGPQDVAAAALRTTALHDPHDLYAVVEDEVCNSVLADRAVELLLDLTEAYYIDRRASGGGFGASVMSFGIRDHRRWPYGFPFAGYHFGPFFHLLLRAPVEAVGVINRMLDHAALHAVDSTRMGLQGISRGHEHVSLDILGTGRRDYVGDGPVYQWYRGTSHGPYPCMSALLALEQISDRHIQDGKPLTEIGIWLLAGAHSLAMVGLWAGILVRHLETVGHELDPLLATPDLWHLEASRVTGEQSRFFAQRVTERHNEERRNWIFSNVASYLVLNASETRRGELKMIGEQLVASDLKSSTLRNWASQLDSETYDAYRSEEGIIIEQHPPMDVRRELDEKLAPAQAFMDTYSLAFKYGRNRGATEMPDAVSLTEDITRSRGIAQSSTESLATDAVAATASVAVEVSARGLIELPKDDLDWCVSQVLSLAHLAPSRSSELGANRDEQWEIGWDRSVAWAVGLMAAAKPHDPEVLSAVGSLALSPYLQTQMILGRSLADVWALPCDDHRTGTEGGVGVCWHRQVFRSLTEMLRWRRFGRWDPVQQTRPHVEFDGPIRDALMSCPPDEFDFYSLAGVATALDICARSQGCTADEAKDLLFTLVDLHGKGWAQWAQREALADVNRARDIHLIAATCVLDGHLDLYRILSDTYAAMPELLGDWLSCLALRADSGERQANLREWWPTFMDDGLRVLTNPVETKRQFHPRTLVEGMIPVPPHSLTVSVWPSLDEIGASLGALIDLGKNLDGLANRLVEYFAVPGSLADTSDALALLLHLVLGKEEHLAGRTRIGDWLRQVRGDGTQPMTHDVRSRWLRLVDSLASLGDERCIRLQQEEE
jgi:hypothetical protein